MVQHERHLGSPYTGHKNVMNRFAKAHVTPSPPSEAVLQVCIREEGVVTQSALRKEQEAAVRGVIPFWPSAGIGTERRLPLPSASWKKDTPSESKPGGKRPRSDRSAPPSSSSSPELPRTAPDSEQTWRGGGRVPLARLPLPLEEATPERPRRGARHPRRRVYVGNQAARWGLVKAELGWPSDEEVARVLLDVFIEKQMHQPGPSRAVQEADLDEAADVNRDSAKEDNGQAELDSVPSLSVGSESTVTLSHPSSIGSIEDETDSSLFSGAGSASDSISKHPVTASGRAGRPSFPRAKAEPAEWESDSEGRAFSHRDPEGKEAKNTGTDLAVPPEPRAEGPERQRPSDGDVIRICIGEDGGTAYPEIKIEREDPCSLPSPAASTGSDSTVTLSHPSSDISFEEDCCTEADLVSESDTEAAVTRRRKRMASPARNCRCEQRGALDIGKEIDRWNSLKQSLRLKSDEEMARALLDVYTKTHSIPLSPITTIATMVKEV
ncbi:uncharacterized protein LOC132832612 [Hemiscyllium ocellatum]|uniref:uncharacterized protein LOC132832612 n=1 Tax=Hemiscyllium ocellatum TaxID=170820 RepID=UPI002965EEE4|nr:uncharacterized protein LOC132832612 [Hemiscyllium ocellatum]